ncbi:endonuclease domain-containing protein [Erythrobacter sp. sf7]|uniref:Endonuclease domain-containing protein n=1 Tax=Erythrobacter fulvus TaxID=2987523 RepID=A0ABT5JR69_9SPHN|nr:endonuclease domain-containing protein [Erythrobacter fulvus]MDC8755272.1 endonuclease domain-containing protein [Erythrobacter fulvus]
MIRGQKETVKLARKLRADMTPPEIVLWQALRQRPGGHKFRRQHPAGIYVLDFFCSHARLAIEVDGRAHESPNVIAKDAARSRFLREQGVATMRIPAKLVLEDIEAVVRRLVQICDERLEGMKGSPLPHPAGGPPPRSGEDS